MKDLPANIEQVEGLFQNNRLVSRVKDASGNFTDPDLPTASRLIEQYKIALPTISGQNRRNYFVIPFTKQGFAE